MDLAIVCDAYFLLSAAAAVGGTLIPPLQKSILDYGRNLSQRQNKPHSSFTNRILSLICYQVPHSWFMHYYITSVISSIFWGIQIATRGTIIKSMAHYSAKNPSMSGNQIVISWLLLAIQGCRRLYECNVINKPSQSRMWIGLWLIGIVYYICNGISVWIEGSGMKSLTCMFTGTDFLQLD